MRTRVPALWVVVYVLCSLMFACSGLWSGDAVFDQVEFGGHLVYPSIREVWPSIFVPAVVLAMLVALTGDRGWRWTGTGVTRHPVSGPHRGALYGVGLALFATVLRARTLMRIEDVPGLDLEALAMAAERDNTVVGGGLAVLWLGLWITGWRRPRVTVLREEELGLVVGNHRYAWVDLEPLVLGQWSLVVSGEGHPTQEVRFLPTDRALFEEWVERWNARRRPGRARPEERAKLVELLPE